MRRCRTKKNKKWVQRIQRWPRPALSGTWCILWRFWTQSLTRSPSVNISCFFFSARFQYFFSFMPLFISHHRVHVLFHDAVLCVLLCVSQWNGPVSRTTKWKWQTVELPLSGTINTFSLFSCPSLITSEYWWVANERKKKPAEEVAQEHL